MESKTPVNKRKRNVGTERKHTAIKSSSNPRVERKRTQNRISQQCVREKQLAHSLQLENLIQTIRSANGGIYGDDSREIDTIPMSAYLSLVEENGMLKDALLRLRKRLLSFSSLVGTTANDEVFDYILKNNTTSRQGRDSSSLPESCTHNQQVTIEPSRRVAEEQLSACLTETSSSSDWNSNAQTGVKSNIRDSISFSPHESTVPGNAIRHTEARLPSNAITIPSTFTPFMPNMLDFSMQQTISTPRWPDSCGTGFEDQYSFHPDVIREHV